MNRVCEVLGIEKPIIQGPMAWISTAPLVAAASNAGGLGVLGVAFAPEPFIREQVAATKELTDKPFGMNVDMYVGDLEMTTRIIEDLRPPVIYADTYINLCEKKDLAMKYFKIWHDLGCKVVVKASTVADAITAEEAGADAIMLKGWEGGGHVSYEATTVLVPQAADAVSVPVIASGGIADGRGAAAAIALGAEGVEMGTIFMAATDAPVHPNVKQAVLDCGDMDTVITGMCTGEPCRQIKNKLSDELLKIEAENVRAVSGPKVQEISMSSLRKAMAEGDMENGAVMAGQIAALITEQKTVAEIIDGVIAEAKEVLAKISSFEF
ncbi:MAG: hypothetical protein E7236_07300 [Lachnospiraceae bacterium]|nr:hypothetical protein [Lachnospiraceae bacterium]